MSGRIQNGELRQGSPWREPLCPRGRRYAGEPFDTTSRHSVQIVVPQGHQQPIDPHDACVVVDYLYHLGDYWRARIPLNGVTEIRGQAFNFSKIKTKPGPSGPEPIFDHRGVPRRSISALNHIQTRFIFDSVQPIELYQLTAEEACEPSHLINDIVYSIEAVGPLGVKFNFRDAMAGNVIAAHRLYSTQEMVFERIVVENMYVLETAPLRLDAPQRRAALAASILRSHEAGMNETYYLYRPCHTNNCTSSPFREIDRIADYSVAQWLGSFLYRLPLNPRLYLRLRGLDSDSTVTNLVRDEFRDYVGDAETVRRKREYVRSHIRAMRDARKSR
jgi:hypothetical protein